MCLRRLRPLLTSATVGIQRLNHPREPLHELESGSRIGDGHVRRHVVAGRTSVQFQPELIARCRQVQVHLLDRVGLVLRRTSHVLQIRVSPAVRDRTRNARNVPEPFSRRHIVQPDQPLPRFELAGIRYRTP